MFVKKDFHKFIIFMIYFVLSVVNLIIKKEKLMLIYKI
jgi:hypothetical protein